MTIQAIYGIIDSDISIIINLTISISIIIHSKEDIPT